MQILKPTRLHPGDTRGEVSGTGRSRTRCPVRRWRKEKEMELVVRSAGGISPEERAARDALWAFYWPPNEDRSLSKPHASGN